MNDLRSQLTKAEAGFFYHESAYVDQPAKIGAGTRIWHFTHIMENCEIGENCGIGQNVVISANVKLGNNVKIQNNVSVYTGVICEDDVFLGPSMVFTNVINPRSHVSRRDQYQTTVVRKGATLGANCTIVCGITLGEYCLVGAGALVSRDVKPYALVYGNPSRQRGWVCQCGAILSREVLRPNQEPYICSECKKIYRENEGHLECLSKQEQ